MAYQDDEEYCSKGIFELPIAISDNYAVTPFLGATFSEISIGNSSEPRNDFRAGEYGVSFDRTSQRFPLKDEDFNNLNTSVYSYIGAGLSIYNPADTTLDPALLMHLKAGTVRLSGNVFIGAQARYTFNPSMISDGGNNDAHKFQLLITFVPVFLGRMGL